MGQCGSSGDGPGKNQRAGIIKKLIDGAAQDKAQFVNNVAQLKGALASDETTVEDSKVAVQVITEGILSPEKPDEHRFWYLLVLRHMLEVKNKKLAETAAKKLGNTFKKLAMHRADERIMSRGRDCLESFSSNLGRLALTQTPNGQSDSSTCFWNASGTGETNP